MKRRLANAILQGGLLIPVLLPLTGCFHVANYSAAYTQPGLRIPPSEILVLAFEKDTYSSGSHGSSQTGAAGIALHLLAIVSLFTIPAPTDWRLLRQPELWTPTEIIGDKPIPLIHDKFNRSILKNGIELGEVDLAGRSVRDLIQLARDKGVKYLYLVRYNVYRHYSESSGNLTISYSGYIPAASRVLIDVTTGETVFVRTREGEAYFFAFPWINGYWTDPALWPFHGKPLNVHNYISEIGSRDYEGCLNRLSRYILLTDLVTVLKREDQEPKTPFPNPQIEL